MPEKSGDSGEEESRSMVLVLFDKSQVRYVGSRKAIAEGGRSHSKQRRLPLSGWPNGKLLPRMAKQNRTPPEDERPITTATPQKLLNAQARRDKVASTHTAKELCQKRVVHGLFNGEEGVKKKILKNRGGKGIPGRRAWSLVKGKKKTHCKGVPEGRGKTGCESACVGEGGDAFRGVSGKKKFRGGPKWG